ncbi:MAG: restriction endonuclease subunit S [Bacteroidota bacterium]|nr:restriction endonuclease subunit S [Bacteroidota bacterium]
MSSSNNQLPKDWKWVKVGEYVISVKGKKPKRLSKEKTKECSIPYVNIKAFEKNIIDEYTDGVGCALCDDGDFLMVWDGSRSGYVGRALRGALGSTLVKLNFPNIENNYAYYFLQSKYNEINTRAKGVGIPHVDPNILWNYDLLIPPKPTQQAIVSKIEELFSKLDKGIENLQTAQQQLKTYRQSVLKWAFEGKLTNSLNHDSYDLHDEHDLNIAAEPEIKYNKQNNQDNQNNQINHSSDKGELPKGWKWIKSCELFDFVTSGSRGWAKYYSDKGAIFIRITNLDFDSLDLDLEESKIQYVNPPSNSEGIRTKVREGDFLFSITGYLGMFAIAPKLDNAFVNQHISLCRPKNGFNNRYVGYWIISKAGGHYYLNKMTKGATKAGLGLDDIKKFPIPIAPIAEQNNIVQAIERRLSVADKMEESITQSLQQAEALRQSILKKAFEGKLV